MHHIMWSKIPKCNLESCSSISLKIGNSVGFNGHIRRLHSSGMRPSWSFRSRKRWRRPWKFHVSSSSSTNFLISLLFLYEIVSRNCQRILSQILTRKTKRGKLLREMLSIFIPHQWRIQDFPQGGAPTPKIAIIFHIFAENCMKMKEFGPPGGGRASLAPPLGSANAHVLAI